MATSITNQLTHTEASELLPWHVNASLNEDLSRQVAQHVEVCGECQEEAAILSSTIMAFNTSEPDYRDVDNRFNRLMDRIHDDENAQQVAPRQTSQSSIADLIASWIGVFPIQRQWVTAFALGVIIGGSALFGTLRWTNVPVDDRYEVLADPTPAALQLLVQFSESPSSASLAALRADIGANAELRELTELQYVIEIGDDASVRAVAEIRARLLSYESIETVKIDVPEHFSE